VFKQVNALSGGEKSRLRLCILMRENINLLILDEPTNHQDIQSRERIEQTLEDYGEALLFVSHDRYFIDKFADRVLSLGNGVLTDFNGGFAEYREYKDRQEKNKEVSKNDTKKRDNKKKTAEKPETLIAKAEREIERTETRIAELDALAAEFSSDYVRLLEIDGEKRELDDRLLELYGQWERLTED
jgi:ATPase subunit of ABC transporter with duplicated ATPase domains